MRNLTFKAAMLKGSQPTVNRQSTDGQSQRHCKQTPLSKRWKVLMTLVFLFTLAIGQMWGACATEGTIYKFACKSSLSGNTNITDNPVTITTSNYLASFEGSTGAAVTAYNTDKKFQIASNGMKLADKSKSYLILNLGECRLKKGDIIKTKITSQNAKLTTAVSSGTDILSITKNANEQTLTIDKDWDSNGTIYLMATSNGAIVYSFEVIRPYTITLDATTNGGLEVDPVKGADGDKVILPHAFKKDTDPVKYYKFKGWYENHTGGDPVSNIYAVSGDKTLYAQFEDIPTSGPMFTLQMESSLKPTSNVDLKAASSTETVYLNLLQYATISGGAAVASTKGTSAGIQILTTPAIKMNGQGGCIKVDLDAPLQSGDEITAAGVSANIWFTNSDTRPSSAPSTILGKTSPIKIVCDGSNLTGSTFYIYYSGSGATFTGLTITRPATYTVTFDNNGHGGTAPEAQSGITSGGKATEPTDDPVDDNYNFGGWYNKADWQADGAEKWNFGTSTVTKDTTLYAKWTDKSVPSTDATLNALSVAGCTFNETFDPATLAYTVDLPFYASMPTASAVTATKNDANASDPVVSVSGNVISVEVTPQSGAGDKKTYTITVTIASTPAASSSINIEQLILDNSTDYNIGAALDAAHIGYANKDALDSLKSVSEKDDRNEPYLGLKFKKNTSSVTIIVPDGQYLKVKFGYVDSNADLKVSVNGATAATPSLTSGVYTLPASAGMKQVVFTQPGTDKKTVVYKQIKINADIDAVTLPWLVTYDAGEHGTCATAKETWKGTDLTLPTVTPESGWNFDGWKDDENNDATSPYKPTKDVTLIAQYSAQASPFDLTALTYQIGSAAAVNVGYEDGTYTYNIELPYKPSYDAITVAPTLKVGTSSIKEGAVLTVSSLPGSATFTVVEAGGASEQLYTINFTKKAKDGVLLIGTKVTGNTAHGTVYGYGAGTADVKVSSKSGDYTYKFNRGNYVGVTLADGLNFQAGDIVKIRVFDRQNATGFTLYTTNDQDSALIMDTRTNTVIENGIHELTLPNYAGSHSLYLLRADNTTTGNMNLCVDSIAVYRAYPKPVLTAMTINGVAATIDNASATKTITAAVPYNTDFANMTLVETFMSNDPTQTTGLMTGAWMVVDNEYQGSYVVTDKDGDTETYVVTLTKAPHYEAKIGETGYATLVAAVAAAQDGDEIVLQEDVTNGAGVMLTKTDAKEITIDFGGYTYTAVSPAVGSAGTQNQAFHLEKGNTVTLKNGTITSSGSEIKMLIQNYCDLTLEDITLDGTGLEGSHRYVMSNNCGDVVIGDGTTITAKTGDVAFDVCATNYYPEGVTVTVKEGATISGIVEYDVWGTKPADNHAELAIEGGNFTITWNVESALADDAKDNLNVSGGTFTAAVPADYCAEGYMPKDNGDGSYGVQPKDPMCLIKVELSAPDDNTVATPTITVGYGNTEVGGNVKGTKTHETIVGYKFNADGAYLYVTLANGSFQAGDSVEVYMTYGAKALVVYPHYNSAALATSAASASATLGKNYVVLAEGADTLYLARNGNGWNPNVAYIAVYRVANPMLQKFELAGEAGVINEAAKTVAVEVPYATDVTALEPTIHYMSNGDPVAPAVAVSPAGAQDFSSPVVYTITDKDGSTTSYTVTVSIAEPSTDATLSALSYGGTAIALEDGVYDYIVNLAKGTTVVPALAATAHSAVAQTPVIDNATEFVNYQATSSVVVTAQNGTTTQTYTVLFKVAHSITALVDVTENTVWDWTTITARADGSEIDEIISEKKHGPRVATEDGLILANYVLGGDNWDKIEGNNTAYAIRNTDNKYYQGASLHMHTTVSGYLKIHARNDGSSMTLNVQNAGRDMEIASLGNWAYYTVYVQAGDVVIYNVPASGTKPMRIDHMEFKVDNTPDYTRTEMLGNGVYGTICLPYNVPAGGVFGVTIYELMGREPQYGKLAFDEIVSGEMEAGVPYVFQAHGDALSIFYGETHVDDPVSKDNGMYGTFTNQTLTDLDDVYYFAQRALWSCDDLTELNLPANRAYVKLSEIDYLTDPNPAPGRRRITMTVNGEQVTTGIGEIETSETPMKVLIDGQIFIIRGEKMFDVTGKLVK